MMNNANLHAKQSNSARSKRIGKKQKLTPAVRDFLFKPVDEVIGQCVDIHKTLQRSSQMLSDFSRELRSITSYLDQMRFEDHPDDLTVYNFDGEESHVIEHRNLFARLDDVGNCSVDICSEEQFRKEICGLRNNKGRTAVTSFSMPLLDIAHVTSPNEFNTRMRIASIANENDS